MRACAASGHALRRMAARNSRVSCETSLQGSRTMSFSPVIKVRTVSGAASAYLMRSQFTARGLPLRRVSSIMCVRTPPGSFIGREVVGNRKKEAGDYDDGAKRDLHKVNAGDADEVGERGAYRMVNRIS